MRWSIFSNSSKVTSFLRQVEGRKIFVKAVLYWTPVKCLFFLMYEAFYAKLQLRETFIIIPQKPDLHQKFGAIVMELSFSHGAKKRSGKRSRSKMTGYAEIYPPKIKSNKIKKSPRSLRALYGHGLLLLLLGGFFAVALKFFAGHDIDDTEIDIAHFKAGHFLDLATDIDLDAVEDGRRRRAVFKDGFDLDGRCCTVNGSGDALGGFGAAPKLDANRS